MVTDSLKYSEKYNSLHKHFEEAFRILKSLTPDSPSGKIVIEEGNAWVNVSKVSEVKEKDDPIFEAHEKFIDIHCLIKGSEIFGYANLDQLDITEPFDPARDVTFAKGHIIEVKLSDGDFIVTFPEDAHIPNMKKLSEGVSTRAIAKIRV